MLQCMTNKRRWDPLRAQAKSNVKEIRLRFSRVKAREEPVNGRFRRWS